MKKASSVISSIFSKVKEKGVTNAFVISIAVFSFLVTVLLNQFLFPYYSNDHDEGVYIFQMKMLAQGEIYLKNNNYSDFFNSWFTVNDGEKIYPKYSPVHSLILAVSYVLFGNIRIAIGFLALLNIVLVYSIAKEIYGNDIAKIAAIVCVSSPLFLIISSTYLSYTSSFTLNLTFIYFYTRSLKNNDTRYSLFAGTALGISFFARPYDAVLVGAPFILYSIYKMFEKDYKRKFAGKLFFICVSFLPFVLIALTYNYILTGNPLVFPFNKYEPLDTLGFGIKRMSSYSPIYQYTINSAFNTSSTLIYNLLFNWTLTGPFLIFFLIFIVAKAKRFFFDGLFLILLASVAIGNFLFWGNYHFLEWENSIDQFGPVYYFNLILPLSLISGRVIYHISNSVKFKSSFVKSLILVIFILISILFVLPKIEVNYEYTKKNERLYAPFINGNITDALIFLPTPYGPFINHPFGYLINEPSFNGSIVYAQNKGYSNINLIKAYSNRNYYSYEYDGVYTESYKDNLTSRLIRLYLIENAVIEIKVKITNPSDKKFVFSYIWNNGSIKSYLLDDNSKKGRSYNVTWYLKPNEAVLVGDYLNIEGSLSKLKNNTFLALSSAFSDSSKGETKEIYEYRYTFIINGKNITLLSPGEAWQNDKFPQDYWIKANITKIVSSRV